MAARCRPSTSRATGAAAPPRLNLVELLESSLHRLSSAQRHVAEHVLRSYRDVVFMSVAELARATGVSPAGVVRFAGSLGFRGYPEFQRALQAIIRSELRQADRFAAALENGAPSTLPDRILGKEVDNLVAVRANLDRRALDRAVVEIGARRRVAVVGLRASATLAHYLWYNLRKVKPDVLLYDHPGSVTLDEILLAPAGTLVVLIAFPRYSRELMDVAGLVRDAGFPTIGITNNEMSPLAPLCRLNLFVEVGELSFTDFYAAPLALINALVAEVARRSRGRALARLTQLDDLAAARGYLVSGPPHVAAAGR